MNGPSKSYVKMMKVVDVVPPLTRLPDENGMSISPSDSITGSTKLPLPFHSVVTLNVGGVEHTTSLDTLRKFEDSMLASMFSGRHCLSTDANGRFFIDRNGNLFQHILNFLRNGTLPPLSDALAVYEEAQFFNIEPLIFALKMTKPVAGFKLKVKFLNEVPSYQENFELLLSKLKDEASIDHSRVSKVLVCVVKEDGPMNPYENSLLPPVPAENESATLKLCRKRHRCNVAVTFGPWNAGPDVFDLIDCLKHDFSLRGFYLEQQCIGTCDEIIYDTFHCKRPIYEFKVKWW